MLRSEQYLQVHGLASAVYNLPLNPSTWLVSAGIFRVYTFFFRSFLNLL